MSKYIRLKQGLPVLADFKDSEGSPIVIDTTTGNGYYLSQNIIFPLRADGAPAVTNAYDDGFSGGFS